MKSLYREGCANPLYRGGFTKIQELHEVPIQGRLSKTHGASWGPFREGFLQSLLGLNGAPVERGLCKAHIEKGPLHIKRGCIHPNIHSFHSFHIYIYMCVCVCDRVHRHARWIGGLSHQSNNLSCLCNLLQNVVNHALLDTRFKGM